MLLLVPLHPKNESLRLVSMRWVLKERQPQLSFSSSSWAVNWKHNDFLLVWSAVDKACSRASPSIPPMLPRLAPNTTCRVPCPHIRLPVSLRGCPANGISILGTPFHQRGRSWWLALCTSSPLSGKLWGVSCMVCRGCPPRVGLQLPTSVICWPYTF